MRISGLAGAGFYGFTNVRVHVRARDPLLAPTAQPASAREPLVRLESHLRELRLALDGLGKLSDGLRIQTARRGRPAIAAVATSAAALDLAPYASFTTLRSTQEINAIPTSFSPRGPDFSGASTSLPTVGGIYDGDQGDDVLTFRARDNAVVGSGARLRFRVFDGSGARIQNLNFTNRDVGEAITLSNGLTLSLDAGVVVRNETFSVSVSTSVGSSVDPTKPFDGTRNDDPGFEPGAGVVAGSFEINGTSIAVAADDSIDSVLARISASSASVSAQFDAATESVVLTQKNPGSVPDIALGADDSGFLAATKLLAATPVPGQDGIDPTNEVISSVDALNGISSGDFSVNGVDLTVDVDTDTLGDVLDRINASSAGVRASLDPATLRVSVLPDDPSASLTLADGTSGLWSALQITPGVYDPQAGTQSVKRTHIEGASELRPLLYQVGRFLGQVFADAALTTASPDLIGARDTLRSALTTAAVGEENALNGQPIRTGLGIDLALDDSEHRVLDVDSQRLDRAISRKSEEVHALLFAEAASDGRGGLQTALLEAVEGLQSSVGASLARIDARGRLIDLRV